jgi:hypothetical protein
MDRKPELDELSAEWRLALADAEDALGDIAHLPKTSRLPDSERRDLKKHLAEERGRTGQLLDAVAHEQHVHLVHHVAAPRPTRHALGLPQQVEVCVFDTEALLAGSDTLQETAWAHVLDPFLFVLAERAGPGVAQYRPVGQGDYRRFLHGRTRLEGLHAFLGSRGIRVTQQTAEELVEMKGDVFERLLEHQRPSALGGSRAYVEALHEAALRPVVVSESAHAPELLAHAGFELPVYPSLRTACAKPERGALFATTRERVEEGKGFALVVGIEAVDDTATLLAAGATRVVEDLGEIY